MTALDGHMAPVPRLWICSAEVRRQGGGGGGGNVVRRMGTNNNLLTAYTGDQNADFQHRNVSRLLILNVCRNFRKSCGAFGLYFSTYGLCF